MLTIMMIILLLVLSYAGYRIYTYAGFIKDSVKLLELPSIKNEFEKNNFRVNQKLVELQIEHKMLFCGWKPWFWSTIVMIIMMWTLMIYEVLPTNNIILWFVALASASIIVKSINVKMLIARDFLIDVEVANMNVVERELNASLEGLEAAVKNLSKTLGVPFTIKMPDRMLISSRFEKTRENVRRYKESKKRNNNSSPQQ